jgi:4-hydroxy-tetrahydrodipicolinate synthase
MRASFDYRSIRGILPTVLTPYDDDDDERVDVGGLRAEVSYLLDAGVHGIVLLGSFGEAPYVSDAERELIVASAVDEVAGRVPVIVGITALSTHVAAEQLGQAAKLGSNAVMVCLPQYFQVDFHDVKRHFTRLSELELLPIFYYHYPAATGLKLRPPQIAELLAIPNVVGIKETIFDMLAVKRHIALVRQLDRVFLSGSELNFVEFMDLGGHGTVSASSAIMPRTAVAMYDAYRSGDRARAKGLQAELFETMPILKDISAPIALTRTAFREALRQGLEIALGNQSTQARVKAALARRGLPIRPVVRSPLHPLTPRDVQAVQQAMQKIEAIEPSPAPEAATRRADVGAVDRQAHWAKTAARTQSVTSTGDE